MSQAHAAWVDDQRVECEIFCWPRGKCFFWGKPLHERTAKGVNGIN